MSATFFASDFHIGYPQANYEAIHKFLDLAEKEASELFLLGDTFELIWNDWKGLTENIEAFAVITHLERLSRKIDLTIITGNHDPVNKWPLPLWRFPPQKDTVWNGYYLTHGHQFDPSIKALDGALGWLYRFLPYVKDKLFSTPFERKGESERYNLHISSIHSSVFQWAAGRELKGIIFGHTHFPLYEYCPSLDLEIVNTGDMVDSLSYAVSEGDGLELQTI